MMVLLDQMFSTTVENWKLVLEYIPGVDKPLTANGQLVKDISFIISISKVNVLMLIQAVVIRLPQIYT